MRRMGTATEEELSGFDKLLQAALEHPQTVPVLVSEPEMLEFVNRSPETVLHWRAGELRPWGSVAARLRSHKL